MAANANVHMTNVGANTINKASLWSYIWKFRTLYFISLPGILYFIIFRYVPLAGSVMAFQNFSIFSGLSKSPWVGFANFKKMFEYHDFYQILANNLLIGLYDIVFKFPAAIILALLLNELRLMLYKRLVQTVVYMPHFLSWVVISGIAASVFSPVSGLVTNALQFLHLGDIYLLGDDKYIRSVLVGSGIWRETGYFSIIYLAALAGVNPELYEAAEVDGANRWRQTISVTIPAIMPTIVIMLLLQIGHFLDFGFERVWVFLNELNRGNGEILDTYIYRVGILDTQYSYTTAIGLFKSVVGLFLLLICNFISRKTTGESLF